MKAQDMDDKILFLTLANDFLLNLNRLMVNEPLGTIESRIHFTRKGLKGGV